MIKFILKFISFLISTGTVESLISVMMMMVMRPRKRITVLLATVHPFQHPSQKIKYKMNSMRTSILVTHIKCCVFCGKGGKCTQCLYFWVLSEK